MRAAIVTTPGPPDVIEIVDLPVPQPGPRDVVIAVEAATVNPVDAQTRSGMYHDIGWVTVPTVGLGWDVAGTVSATGTEVDGIALGQRVAAFIGGVDRVYGAYAEAVPVAATDVALVPDELSFTEAATIPLNATTASQALDLLGDSEGRSLLVTGAAGAVGGYALELARERGFAVTGLARGTDELFVKGAGATFAAQLSSGVVFDAVLDAAAIGEPALAHIVDQGAFVGLVPIAVPPTVRGISVQAVIATPDGKLLAKLLEAAAGGELTTRIHATFPLARAADAHRALAEGSIRGRIVLNPQPSL